MTDKHHGEGGTYEVDKATGERRRVEEATKPHPEGDRPRDAQGKPIEEKPAGNPQPALPAPAPAPWASAEASTPAPAPAPAAEPKGTRKGV
jgi:hypothetical protein